jgi:chemotaxis protein methyltransferase WspC
MREIEIILGKRLGLDSGTIGLSAIQRATQSRMKTQGLAAVDAYVSLLQANEAEVQALIEEVVVPETWFFRDGAAFDLLVRLARKRALQVARPLRLLSFPCSSGEEPYSMVMALLQAGVAAPSFVVDAVDVSARVLEKARKGAYTRNSFREDSPPWRARFFTHVGNGFHLIPTVRQHVTFQQGSLVDPNLQLERQPYDFIFCRNVLIYLTGAARRNALEKLRDFLAPEGVLFVTPAEAPLLSTIGFIAAVDGGSVAFSTNPDPSKRAPIVRTVPRTKHPVSPRPREIKTAPVSALPIPPKSKTELASIKALADAGNLEEAEAACHGLMRETHPTADIYCLLGILRDAQGRADDARRQYSKALYLDPNHQESLVHLALLKERAGDAKGAALLYARAKRSTL